MKKAALLGGLCLVLVFCLGGWAQTKDMPGADPGALWNYITKTSPYKNWKFWLDFAGMQTGRSPHGSKVEVFVNHIALNSGKNPLPSGSMQVKEGFNDAGQMTSITVMYKVKGYNPKAGDWFWVKYTPQGRARPFGKPRGRIACHGVKAENDYVLVHDLKYGP